MDINSDIQKKAQKINQENFKKSQYLYDCEKAGLCPKCGEKVDSKLTGSGFWLSSIHTCKNCGRIHY